MQFFLKGNARLLFIEMLELKVCKIEFMSNDSAGTATFVVFRRPLARMHNGLP